MEIEPIDGASRCELCGESFIYASIDADGNWRVGEQVESRGGVWAHSACFEGGGAEG